jgi:hypothetical protein
MQLAFTFLISGVRIVENTGSFYLLNGSSILSRRTNIMQLVTVTCTRDLNHMVLLSHSIDVYVETPCTHLVIIEDDATPLDVWAAMLDPYYKRHTLRLLKNTLPDQAKSQSGWVRQQSIKLLAASLIEADYYLVLDSKNFFIQPVDLTNWPIIEGNDTSFDTTWKMYDKWKPWIDHVHDVTGIETPKTFWRLWTPFTLKTDTVKNIIETVDVVSLFDAPFENKSEFLLYRFFSEMIPVTGTKINHVFQSFQNIRVIETSGEFNTVVQDPALLTVGLHIKGIDAKLAEFPFIREWTRGLGLDQELFERIFNKS